MPRKNQADSVEPAGRAVAVGDRGIWVPNGLDGADVWAGAQALLREHKMYDLDRYAATHMAATVLEAVNASRQVRSV